jgi:hypothetical protein
MLPVKFLRRRFMLSASSVAVAMLLAASAVAAAPDSPRDLRFFLHRLRTLDHLPEIEPSHTALSSTWDRTGGNNDGTDFKRIEGDHNILLDIDGPACIHRIFVGRLGEEVAGTRIQIVLDNSPKPLFDLPVDEFFDDKAGPIPYPLVFHKTYPGTLFPIPFVRHCRVQLVNPEAKNWGCYWQITYTQYAPGTSIGSLTWPPSEPERSEMKAVCDDWLRAESAPPEPPAQWTIDRQSALAPGQDTRVSLPSCGVIRQMRVRVEPSTADALNAVRMQVRWDGQEQPAVDLTPADFFGNADAGRLPGARYNSMLLGAGADQAYCRFPMPFARGAELRFINEGSVRIDRLGVLLDVEKRESLPANWGRFHATRSREHAAMPGGPRFGLLNRPAHIALDQPGPGKYVGVLLQVDWPWKTWWGEGDWLIWSDETGWPPSYHGTGSEEYFNSGWCKFDRKAVSGYVTTRPGHPTVYSFHLNDAFQFQRSIRVAEETEGYGEADRTINEQHPWWTSTAYWYALPAATRPSQTAPPR